MKDAPSARIHALVEGALRANLRTEEREALEAVHAAHADFVWATLQRFGVAPPDLEDAFQDVFVVVQKQLPRFDGACPITTWLFAICRRVASTHRRRANARRDRHGASLDEVPDPSGSPEEATAAAQARAELARILDAMDLDRRAVFVMFEIEELPCDEIAAIVGVPIGTVYSRLHAARRDFAAQLAKARARRAHRGEP